MTRVRIRLPNVVRAGEPFAVRALITHPMETGLRIDRAGQTVPRGIIHRFTCTLDLAPVIDIAFEPAISADPFVEFDVLAERSGRLDFAWYDESGAIHRDSRDIKVE
ncbi:thiosulfate oxidation carrier complex protein SoxZ [Paracoccus sp. R86501]|uniref:thiosulfate oxidation carrier complex protein SoxZ n=1 Tax=Paracoccus sp. R86501 TaxID=3101711 RepID=UPI0036727A65